MPKTDAAMALEEKIDLARTLVRFKARRTAARELNEVEDAIKKRHDAEVAAGSVSQIDLESISVGSLADEWEVEDGDSPGELTAGDPQEEAA